MHYHCDDMSVAQIRRGLSILRSRWRSVMDDEAPDLFGEVDLGDCIVPAASFAVGFVLKTHTTRRRPKGGDEEAQHAARVAA